MFRKLVLCGAAGLLVSGCSIKLKSEPMEFTCAILDDVTKTYDGADIFKQIQSEGRADLGELNTQLASKSGETIDGDPSYDPILKALQNAAARPGIASADASARTYNILMLSGGGQWGAFGAGMLNKLNTQTQLPHFDVVTGVSTGALQSLLVSTGEYRLLQKQYEISDQNDLVIEGGLNTVTGKGSLYDTAPLRKRIDAILCGVDGKDCSRIQKIAQSDTEIFIGMVELGTGKFKSVDIGRIARAAFPQVAEDAKMPLKPMQARDCITGVAMASSAMSVFFTPIRINNKSYADGGIRYSLFEANAARVVDDFKDANVNMYMLRNGPTVMRHDDPVSETDLQKNVDADPNVKNVALRSYSAIVNQSEVSSIAGLRLSRPVGNIRFATADGYKSEATCPLPKAKKAGDLAPVFDKRFMDCLIKWGAMKAARTGGPWRQLCEPGTRNC